MTKNQRTGLALLILGSDITFTNNGSTLYLSFFGLVVVVVGIVLLTH